MHLQPVNHSPAPTRARIPWLAESMEHFLWACADLCRNAEAVSQRDAGIFWLLPTVPSGAGLHSAQAGTFSVSRVPSDLLVRAVGKGAHGQGSLAIAIRICAPLNQRQNNDKLPLAGRKEPEKNAVERHLAGP